MGLVGYRSNLSPKRAHCDRGPNSHCARQLGECSTVLHDFPPAGQTYFTISVTVVECCTPDVPVTVMGKVPAGVPGTGTGAGVDILLPHRTWTNTKVSNMRQRKTFGNRRFREPTTPTPSNTRPDRGNQRAYGGLVGKDPGKRFALREGAVVEIVKVDDPEAPVSVTDAGLKEQVALEGSPEQPRATPPLKLPRDWRVKV
jgi:hypothetical protein